MKQKIAGLTLALAAASGLAAPVAAQTIPDGQYVIQARILDGSRWGYQVGGCMIIGNNGRNAVPSMYHWWNTAGPSYCGLTPFHQVIVQNAQSVWNVSSIRASNGKQAYVLRSQVNGSCLIRSGNGYATSPSLHMWTELGGPSRFCGFASADALIANGQAAWSIEASPSGRDFLAYALTVNSAGRGDLDFPAPVFHPTEVELPASFSTGANAWVFMFIPTTVDLF